MSLFGNKLYGERRELNLRALRVHEEVFPNGVQSHRSATEA